MLIAILSSASAYSQVYVGGIISQDAIYSPANNPYIVTQDLIVSNGVTLKILPGVELDFSPGKSLINNGTLIANGTSSNKISFLPKYPLQINGQWGGIVLNNSSTVLNTDSSFVSGTLLSNVVVSGASYSITLDQSSSVLLENNLIEKCAFGIYIKESGFNTIRNNTLKDCDFGIFIANGFQNQENKVYKNTISKCNDVGIFINSNSSESNHNFITDNLITLCNIGLHIGNINNNGPGYNSVSGNCFIKNIDAVKLFQQFNILIENSFILNTNGIICWHSDNNKINQNLFSRNLSDAISLTAGSSFNDVGYNNICNNWRGILITPDTSGYSLNNHFEYNTLYYNNTSFQIFDTPQDSIQYSNIGLNGNFRTFQNLSSGYVFAVNNFWGTTSESTIDSIVFDLNDEAIRGKVAIAPFISEIIPSAPVPPPNRVIKQKIRNDILVSWDAEALSDLKGYNVHYGATDGISYPNIVHTGFNTSMVLSNFPASDTIVVTAIDRQADGARDQVEGFESDFAFARPVPYAGPDTAICLNAQYSIIGSTAFNTANLSWSTSGDGLFNDSHILNPVYSPGPLDYSNGNVVLFLKDESIDAKFEDIARIDFHDAPQVFAGNDTVIMIDSSLRIINAYAEESDKLKWTSSGDGNFDNDAIVNPVYTPGVGDILNGSVILTFKGFSSCGFAIDQIKVEFTQGYTISGRVHAGSALAPNSRINLFQVSKGVFQPLRTSLLAIDGSFKNIALFGGSYYLYAIPDKILSPGFLPTYYYNDIHWENAYKLDLNANTYDLDIDLAKTIAKLPDGAGSISGLCTSASGSSGKCGDVTVLLYDKLKKNIFEWVIVQNGNNFEFEKLPYGEYVLTGENIGSQVFSSATIKLSPDFPTAQNINLLCTPAGYKFALPAPENQVSRAESIILFPNPIYEYLYISGLEVYKGCEIRLSNSQGIVQKYYLLANAIDNNPLFLGALCSGLYILEVYSDGICITRQKIIKY